MDSFDGSVLIVGAGGGIGQSVALLLAQKGCHSFALADKDHKALERTRDSLDQHFSSLQVLLITVDITQADQVDHMILQASERFKALQYFVNCFGIPSDPAPSLELDTAGFKEVITTIVRGTWLCLRAQVRLALRQDQYPLEPSSSRASIVNVASTLGFATEASMVAQAAGNHGILGMTRSTALDFIDSGIRINCVCPGATDTAFLKSTALLESQRKTAPTNVLIKPDEVAQAIVFLLGPGASAINAVSIPVDRGWSLFHH